MPYMIETVLEIQERLNRVFTLCIVRSCIDYISVVLLTLASIGNLLLLDQLAGYFMYS